jgi:hypothetical protein
MGFDFLAGVLAMNIIAWIICDDVEVKKDGL